MIDVNEIRLVKVEDGISRTVVPKEAQSIGIGESGED